MKPIPTKYTNSILRAPPGHEDVVVDLPVSIDEVHNVVESCWQMTWRERLKVLWRGRIWFSCWGQTHPPIRLYVEEN